VTLADEVEILKKAEAALGAGDTTHAIEALDRYDRVVKDPQMHSEATLLRIQALSRAGKAEAASALARRFVEQNPGSPLVDRARSFVAQDPDPVGERP
jgi:outer membrane protein assembly factor BamD (BamD/ComL family)